ncbi:transposable element Tcb1 transposase [Trichonephila clavipes]|nr:transposable element Tcb1 transposase [Trichonephila clavipes]
MMKEKYGWQNAMKLSLLTSRASVCNTTMAGFDSGDTVERGCCMHHHTGPAPGIMVLATAIFQQEIVLIVQRFFVNQQIELLLWPARSADLSPIENMWSIVAQRLTHITAPVALPDKLWQRVEAA